MNGELRALDGTGERNRQSRAVEVHAFDLSGNTQRIGLLAAGPVDGGSVGDGGGHGSRFRNLGSNGVLEAAEELGHRLVDAGDASNGGGARNDGDAIRVVAVIVGLPQGILAPPAAHVRVDDGHKVSGLAALAEQRDKPGGIGSHEREVKLVAIGRAQVRNSNGRVGADRDECIEGTVVHIIEAGLHARDHLGKTVGPGDIRPLTAVRQLEVAVEPLLVGHGLEVAEVGLGRRVDGGDNLVATGGDGLGVASDVVKEAARTGPGVIDLMDIGAQLRTAGRDAAAGLASAGPAVVVGDGLRVDEGLLDLRGRGGLEGRHGDGAHHDGVDRHRR